MNGGGGGYNPNRVYDSNGPEVKIRGTASHVYEKYLQLARDANVSGDRVMAENYLQHAEHYFRIIAAAQAQYPAAQPPVAAAAGAGAQPNMATDAPAASTAEPSAETAETMDADDADEQPYVDDQSMQSSAPSFSLSDAPAADVEDDAVENEEAQA